MLGWTRETDQTGKDLMAEELACLGTLRLIPEQMHLVLLSQYLEAQHRAYLSLIVVRS